MSIVKRVAYLKGLAEGLDLGRHTKEEKVLAVIIDILEDMALEFEEVKGDVLSLSDDVDQLCEDIHALEDSLLEEALDEGEDALDEPEFIDIQCPSCKNELTIDEDMLGLGAINCPNCDETLEFDFEDDEGCCG